MGLQMIVISSSALATMGLVNREGVDTTAAFGVAMQLWTYIQMPAMALGAAASAMAAQNIGAGKWDRVSAITRSGDRLQSDHHRRCWWPCSPSPTGRRSPCSSAATARRCRSPGTSSCSRTWSFLLFGVTMVVFGTVRANGAVIGPLIILAIGLYPVRLGFALGAYPWLGADALWLSFPVSSFANMAMALAFYLHGGWRKARMHDAARPRRSGRGSRGRRRARRAAQPVGLSGYITVSARFDRYLVLVWRSMILI